MNENLVSIIKSFYVCNPKLQCIDAETGGENARIGITYQRSR